MDLEEFRVWKGLTYDELADFLGLTQNRQALAYALGETWPKTDRLTDILRRTEGRVTILAMHERRHKWLHDNKRMRKISEVAVPRNDGASRRHASR